MVGVRQEGIDGECRTPGRRFKGQGAGVEAVDVDLISVGPEYLTDTGGSGTQGGSCFGSTLGFQGHNGRTTLLRGFGSLFFAAGKQGRQAASQGKETGKISHSDTFAK